MAYASLPREDEQWILAHLNRDWLNQELRDDFRLFLFYAFNTLHPRKKLKWSWHVDAMCHALEVATMTEGDRLVLNVGPRHLKSETSSVAYVAWMMGRDPTLKFLVASYYAPSSATNWPARSSASSALPGSRPPRGVPAVLRPWTAMSRTTLAAAVRPSPWAV